MIRNRGYATIRELKAEHGVEVSLLSNDQLLLVAMDSSRGISTDAVRLARIFKKQIVAELSRREDQSCKSSA